MEVKVLVLTNKQILVSQLDEVAPMDIGDPNCKLIEPFLLNDDARVVGYVLTKPVGGSLNRKEITIDDEKDTYQLKLFPWCPLTKQEKVPISADWVVTIVDPIDKITQMYKKEVLCDGSKSSSSNEQTDSSEST